MIVCKMIADASRISLEAKENGAKTGFIPTMGALHDGHISLIRQSKADGYFTICSIFVNPTQFNNLADFEKYPSTLSQDINKLEASGCDLLFLPSRDEIYPLGFEAPHYDLGFLETILEGKYRQGHFQGVCMVVDRLLQIIQPYKLYLGQKDYQQCMVIERLLEITHSKTKIEVCDTLREPGGLAMSSRNLRLSDQQRKQAGQLWKELRHLKENLHKGSLVPQLNNATAALQKAGFEVDYFSVADARSLKPVTNWNGQSKIVALTAAFLGDVRLIDNLILN